MAKKIYGDLSASGNIQINGSNTIRELNNATANDNGDLTIPFYNKQYIDNMLVMTPVTRIGTQDYLPINVNSGVDGSTSYTGKNIYPVLIENDGTLVYLRPGTNGNTSGYYYCYLKQARTITEFNPVQTTTKFKPTFFTVNHVIDSFVSTDASKLLMMNTNNGSDDTYTISLTNSTMNSSLHNSTEFLRTSIPDTIPQYALLHNDLVYIFGIDSFADADEMAISCYTITAADIISGTSSSLTKLTGFSGSNLFGTSITSSNNIKLAPINKSSTSGVDSFVYIDSSNVFSKFNLFANSQQGILHAVSDEDLIRIAFVNLSELITVQSKKNTLSAISFVLDTSTNNYVFDNNILGQISASTDASGNITWVNPYEKNMQIFSGIDTNSTNNKVPTYMTTIDGVQFCVISKNGIEIEHNISRSVINNFSTEYESWNVNTREINNILLEPIYPVYASAIGENLINPTVINQNKIMMHCSGTSNSDTYDLNTTAYTELSGASNAFTYNSVNSGTIQGFSPNKNRAVVESDDGRYIGCITIINEDNSTAVYASSFIEGYESKYSALEMNQSNLSFTQQITISGTVLSTLKSSMIAGVTLPYTVSSSSCSLFYVPDNTYTKSFAITALIVNAPSSVVNSYYIISEVDVTISTNNITAATVSTSTLVSRNLISNSISSSLVQRTGSLSIAKYSDFTFVSMPGIYSFEGSDSEFTSIICKVDNTTKLISDVPVLLSSGYSSDQVSTYEAGAIPGIGFGVYENGTSTDIRTKLIFKNFGNTLSQFNTMISDISAAGVSKFVVVSQETVGSFNVYFPEPVPVLLNGSYYELQETSIDLTTVKADPSNTTFYVYILDYEGTAQYNISTTELSEELWRVYIGTIVTDASSITSTDINKVSRFLTYRNSTTKIGSAIPTSTATTSTRWN